MMRHSALITGRRTWVIPTAIINRSDATKMEAAMIHELASEEGEDQVDEVREEEKEEDSESVLVIMKCVQHVLCKKPLTSGLLLLH